MAATKANAKALNVKKVKADGFMLKQCPATSGLPTMTTIEAWRLLCRETMIREMAPAKSGERIIKPYCSICRGESIPDEVTIKSKKELIEDRGNKMAKRGQCGNCGENNMELRNRTTANGDVLMCNKCRTIHSNAANWPDLVERAMAEAHPEKHGPRAKEMAESNPDVVVAAVSDMTEIVLKRIASAVKYEGNEPFELAAIVEQLGPAYNRMVEKVDRLTAENNALAGQVGDLEMVKKSQREVCYDCDFRDEAEQITEILGLKKSASHEDVICELRKLRDSKITGKEALNIIMTDLGDQLSDAAKLCMGCEFVKPEGYIESLTETQIAIAEQCEALKQTLLEKNRMYGNSALEPVRLFSKADPVEQIRVRIDDKLSRLQSGQADDTEDTETDLAGYLVLLKVAKSQRAA